MEINELKKMLKSSTAVLILDNGEPSFVIVNYSSYKDLMSKEEKEIKVNHTPVAPTSTESPSVSRQEVEMLERINKDILALKAQIEDEEKMLTIDPALEKLN